MKVREVPRETTLPIFFKGKVVKVHEVCAQTHTYKYEENITIYRGMSGHYLKFLLLL